MDTQRIYKYHIKHRDYQELLIPEDAAYLDIQVQGDKIMSWFIVTIGADGEVKGPMKTMRIAIYGTGQPLPDSIEQRYLKTFQLPSLGLVFHVFEVL